MYKNKTTLILNESKMIFSHCILYVLHVVLMGLIYGWMGSGKLQDKFHFNFDMLIVNWTRQKIRNN